MIDVSVRRHTEKCNLCIHERHCKQNLGGRSKEPSKYSLMIDMCNGAEDGNRGKIQLEDYNMILVYDWYLIDEFDIRQRIDSTISDLRK